MADHEHAKPPQPQTLRDEDISTGVGRRAFFFAATAAGVTAAAAIALPEEAKAQGCTDSDQGYGADRAGYGRRCRAPTGCTDGDRGRGSDPVGYGRRCRGSGVTDSDPNDRPGFGRGRRQTGITDSDPGDSPGYGRGGGRRRSCSDSDSGYGSDPAGRGRRC